MLAATHSASRTIEVEVQGDIIAPPAAANTLAKVKAFYDGVIAQQYQPVYGKLESLARLHLGGALIRVNHTKHLGIAEVVAAAIERIAEALKRTAGGSGSTPVPATATVPYVRMSDQKPRQQYGTQVANGKPIEGFPQWFLVDVPAEGETPAYVELYYGQVKLPARWIGSRRKANATAWVKGHGKGGVHLQGRDPETQAWRFVFTPAAQQALPKAQH